jgi:2-haloacid dehalogenase
MQPPLLAQPPQAVLFDAYGTLFDVHSVAALAEQLFGNQGRALSSAWRDKQIEYTRLVSMSQTAGRERDAPFYKPFWDITRDALRHACTQLQLPLSHAYETQLMNQYRALAAYPENRTVLTQLQQRGVRAGILSNGDPDMLAEALRSAGLDALLNPVLSAHSVRRFKTDPAVYDLGPQALGLPAQAILFVSSNAWDALGASWYGYRTLWLNRSGQAFETLGGAPHHVASSLNEVLALFDIHA